MWGPPGPPTVGRGTAGKQQRVERRGRRGGAVDETFRMLGREHQADLDREALRRQWAAVARGSRPARERSRQVSKRRRLFLFRAKVA
jgi:hypothetical protein